MTSSRQRDPPRRGYTVAVEEVGGSWRVPLSRFLAGVPRDWMALRPGRHRDARFRSIILTAESMISSLRRCARASAIAKSTRAPVRSPFFFSLLFPPFLFSFHFCNPGTVARKQLPPGHLVVLSRSNRKSRTVPPPWSPPRVAECPIQQGYWPNVNGFYIQNFCTTPSIPLYELEVVYWKY